MTASRFEIHAYYCGIEREDDTKARIRAGVDHWTDIRPLSDDAAAAKIAGDGIDILVDLNGYTRDARTAVFARRPAPIQANWYGFPGTMGTPYHHYVIADPHVVPEGHEIFFSEKVLRLPCYQPNDRKRHVAPEAARRADEGLPETALRLLLPQRHAEDHAAGLRRLDEDSRRACRAACCGCSIRPRRPTPACARWRQPRASRRTASASRRSARTRSISRATGWPICSSTPSPMARTPRHPMPCGWERRC